MTQNVDVENADKIPDHLIDGYENERQVSAGKDTKDHPGPYNRPTHDRSGNPIQYPDEKNPPAPNQKDTRKKRSNTPDRDAHAASYAGANEGSIKLNWWQRNMPRWLLGATEEDKKRYQAEQKSIAADKKYAPLLAEQLNKKKNKNMDKDPVSLITNLQQEVMTGVSVAALREAGFSDAKIQNMIQVIESKKAAEAQKMGGMSALAAHLAKHGQTIEMNAEELGITNKEVRLIQGIANKNSRTA